MDEDLEDLLFDESLDLPVHLDLLAPPFPEVADVQLNLYNGLFVQMQGLDAEFILLEQCPKNVDKFLDQFAEFD